MSNIKNYGYGKTILFGEHFVVYGLPAFVASLHNKTQANLFLLDNISLNKNHNFKKIELIDNRPKSKNFKPILKNQYHNIIRNILDFAKIERPIRIIADGDLKVFSGGIGSSAAFAVAVSRALNNFFNLNWDDEKINKAAFYGEKAIHGNPSGIDNTAAVFGNSFWFKTDNLNSNYFTETVVFKHPVEIVLIDSGIISCTRDVLKEVADLKNKKSILFNKIFDDYKKLIDIVKDALTNFDLEKIGQLMSINHKLLKSLNVSCNILDEIVSIAIKAGAWGAKLTGTGRGGLVVALTPGKELQNKVATIFEQKNFEVLRTTIG